MHRLPLGLFFIAALYVSGCANATAGTEGQPAPHVALILPLKSEAFGQAAEAVAQGFLAGAGVQPHALPVRVYASSDESREIAGLYRQAVANGARAVAGPLTRDGVAALAAEPSIPVPTLALNVADAGGTNNLYFFGLPAEEEARQVAQAAIESGPRAAIVIHGADARSLRLAQAFAAEWESRGGHVVADVAYRGDAALLAGLSARKDVVAFLAVEAESARLIRPYLDPDWPVFATSQVFSGNADALANFDLKGVRFVDMPWMLEPDHPAVMVYPRLEPSPGPNRERLYALGIDAWRLLRLMLGGAQSSALPLDGVTGQIRLEGRLFRREAVQAIFRQGTGVPLDAPVVETPGVFPALAAPAQ